MFKVGDVVKYKEEYYQDIEESYEILDILTLDAYRVKGFKTEKYRILGSFAIELDLKYYRMKKIDKIFDNINN